MTTTKTKKDDRTEKVCAFLQKPFREMAEAYLEVQADKKNEFVATIESVHTDLSYDLIETWIGVRPKIKALSDLGDDEIRRYLEANTLEKLLDGMIKDKALREKLKTQKLSDEEALSIVVELREPHTIITMITEARAFEDFIHLPLNDAIKFLRKMGDAGKREEWYAKVAHYVGLNVSDTIKSRWSQFAEFLPSIEKIIIDPAPSDDCWVREYLEALQEIRCLRESIRKQSSEISELKTELELSKNVSARLATCQQNADVLVKQNRTLEDNIAKRDVAIRDLERKISRLSADIPPTVELVPDDEKARTYGNYYYPTSTDRKS